MRAVVTTAPQHMELMEQPKPTAGPDEALVRVEAVGLCGSELLF
jgi:threonine dehydrogenase-like Zn-dependent dehydrogenase